MSSTETTPPRAPAWTLGDRLRKARLHANLSTEEMAEDIGRTRHTVSNYERDATTVPLLVLRQYALRTGVPFEWLQTGELPANVVDTLRYPTELSAA